MQHTVNIILQDGRFETILGMPNNSEYRIIDMDALAEEGTTSHLYRLAVLAVRESRSPLEEEFYSHIFSTCDDNSEVEAFFREIAAQSDDTRDWFNIRTTALRIARDDLGIEV